MRPEVIALFREVADRSQADRDDHYARQQVPDALRAEVESLLRFDAAGDSLRGYVAAAQQHLLDAPSGSGGADRARRSTVLPETIGRFAVTRLLGRGGMGEVYLARDPVIGREIAIKLIGGELDDEAARRRLVREARAAGRLHHPNIVTIFEAGEHEDRSYIAMEYVAGDTLGSIIRRRAPFPLRRRLEMIEGACAGLAHAHREGVIHLDIKPDNLMLDGAGVVKVLDFGISRVLQSDTFATAHVVGTLRYMSPEQIQGRPLDHRSDVFSMGCSLFELVTYAPAYNGSTKEIVTQISSGPVPSLLDAYPGVDRRLDRIVSRAMALDPAERYDDLEELRAELAGVRSEIDPLADGSEPPLPGVAQTLASPHARAFVKSDRSSGRRAAGWSPAGMATALVAAALAGTGAFLAWGAGKTPEGSSAPSPPAATLPSSEAARTPAVERPAPVESNDDVWQRLAKGDRAGVLERLEAAGRASADPALAASVVDTVRTTVARARAAAGGAAASGPAAGTYRAAEEQLARANRLAATGQSVQSLRSFWQAADLFAASLATPVQPVPAATDTPAPTLPAATLALESVAHAAPEAIVQPPPPAAPLPAPSVPTISGRTAATSPPPAAVRSDSDAILETLRRYEAAFESLDLAALLTVYPSLDTNEVNELRRTFAGLRTYEMDTRDVRVDVTNDSATARATIARRMAPRVGAPLNVEVATEFRLQRTGGDWVIVDISAR